MRIEKLLVQIKRGETPAARLAFRMAKKLYQTEMPAPRSLYRSLYYARMASSNFRSFVSRLLFYQPMFRACCKSCGKNLTMPLGIPFIQGDLEIIIGDNCHINGQNAFIAGKIFDSPKLILGDYSFLGYHVEIVVAKQVCMGKHVLVAEDSVIMDNPGHPVDPDRRRANQPVDASKVRPVTIEDDVWIGMRSIILPGTTIGRGSVIGAGSVVSKNIPAYSLAVGNPAQVIRSIRAEDKKRFFEELDPQAVEFQTSRTKALQQ